MFFFLLNFFLIDHPLDIEIDHPLDIEMITLNLIII